MEIKIKHVLLTAGAIALGYQAYKMYTKPKGAEKTSSASGSSKNLKEGTLRYDKPSGKVFKLKMDGFDTRWVRLADALQPQPMNWYAYNGKWVWTKWNGKLDI